MKGKNRRNIRRGKRRTDTITDTLITNFIKSQHQQTFTGNNYTLGLSSIPNLLNYRHQTKFSHIVISKKTETSIRSLFSDAGWLLFLSGCSWMWRTGNSSPESPSLSHVAERTACAVTRVRAARQTSMSVGWLDAASATMRRHTATPVTASRRRTAPQQCQCIQQADLRYCTHGCISGLSRVFFHYFDIPRLWNGSWKWHHFSLLSLNENIKTPTEALEFRWELNAVRQY